MTRIWRLEVGEDVLDIERCFDDYKPDQFIPISGRILDENEFIDNIDVAEDDVLLYEPRNPKIKENDGFTFVTKKSVEKDKKKWLLEMMSNLGVKH